MVVGIVTGVLVTGSPAFATEVATVHGTVTFAGNPVVAAEVAVYPVGATAGAVANGSTDQDGRYSISVPLGTWDIVFTPAEPLTPVTKTNVVITGDHPLDVALIQAGVSDVSGRLVDHLGTPIPGLNFQVYGDTGGYGVTTDADGRFTLTARNGAYALSIYNYYNYRPNIDIPYYFGLNTAPNTFVIDGDINLGNIALPKPVHVTIGVLDPDNLPVPNTDVYLNGEFHIQPGFATILGIPITSGLGSATGRRTGTDGSSTYLVTWPANPVPVTVSPPPGNHLLIATTPPIDLSADTDLLVAYQANGSAVTLIGLGDRYSTATSTELTVAAPGVLANDHAPSGTILSATLSQPPAHGALTFNADGSFRYAPDSGFTGTDQFTYRAGASGYQTAPVTVTIHVTPPPAPTITAVAPDHGPVAGGTTVTITGSHFATATAVAFGSTAATTFTIVDDTTITATAPAGSAGDVDVHVTGPGGISAQTDADQYTYDPPAPAVTAISPAGGPGTGGTVVTITGTNLTGATSVTFGGSAATQVTVVSDTVLTAAAPPGTGIVHVTVTTPSGTSATGSADQFTYHTGADLSTTLNASANPVALGDAYTETVVVTNHGPNAATQATTSVAFTGPPVTILAATSSQGTCTITEASVDCSFASLPNGATATVIVTVEPAAVGTVTASATTGAHEPDPAPANTNAVATVTVDNAHGCTMIGTSGSDTINGTGGKDVICALAGNDHVHGGGGDDVIYGGSGADVLDGDNGNDTIYAGDGGSALMGGNGDDILNGGSGNDTIYGDNGNDVINAGDGADTVYGGNGNDTIDAGDGTDATDGGNGADTCTHTEHPTSCTG
ncbi:IPT/TIG domain-containing protein [Catellatospora tritici]|uniref:IPT/TIG domain-containing protein n=1 Tax=Catellatospora tritici TaxID=2851566 RepID=UPI001C2D38E8|nr:IPT/TIG domain-containing protein [Catellatospora tritici]MBV1849340.1 IPT/TIG domain-containing protein [Catellatospora tritici]